MLPISLFTTLSQQPQLQNTVTEPGQSSKAALGRVQRTLKLSLSGFDTCFVCCTVGCNDQFSDLHRLTWTQNCLFVGFHFQTRFALSLCAAPLSSTARFQAVDEVHHSLRSSYVNFLLRVCESHTHICRCDLLIRDAKSCRGGTNTWRWGLSEVPFCLSHMSSENACARSPPLCASQHFKHITLNTQTLPTAIRWNIWKSLTSKWKTVRKQCYVLPIQCLSRGVQRGGEGLFFFVQNT